MVMERKFTALLLLGLCLVVGYVDARNLKSVKGKDVKKPESFLGDSPIGIGVGGAGGDGGYGGGGGGGYGGGIGKGVVGGIGGFVGVGGIGGYGGIGGGIFKGIGGGIGGAAGGTLKHVDANKQP